MSKGETAGNTEKGQEAKMSPEQVNQALKEVSTGERLRIVCGKSGSLLFFCQVGVKKSSPDNVYQPALILLDDHRLEFISGRWLFFDGARGQNLSQEVFSVLNTSRRQIIKLPSTFTPEKSVEKKPGISRRRSSRRAVTA
jgi:hypothetical protein